MRIIGSIFKLKKLGVEGALFLFFRKFVLENRQNLDSYSISRVSLFIALYRKKQIKLKVRFQRAYGLGGSFRVQKIGRVRYDSAES